MNFFKSIAPHHRRLCLCSGRLLLCTILQSVVLATAPAAEPRERLLLDFGWKFHLGSDRNWGTGENLEKVGSSRGPASPRNFNDSSWRTVNLPHDWTVELPFDSRADMSHGYKPLGPGFTSNSVAWYRRAFNLGPGDENRRLWLEFDGVYRNCLVYLNGYLVSHNESGYSSFRVDITDFANHNGRNVLAVRVDASQFEGWFYEGAGIYRHVWLVKTDPLAIAPDGTFVYTQFKNNLPSGAATVRIATLLVNSRNSNATARVKFEIIGPNGKTVAQAEKTAKCASSSPVAIEATTSVSSPILWSPETPQLYRLITTVESGGNMVDRTETEFGIRTLAFDAKQGFLLNGRPYVIKGTCNHQDHAGVGSALPDRLQYFRIQELKEMGDNAYRTSHNPPTPELLEACDHLGMLVMDECRSLSSDDANLTRLAGQISRDRNHPSVFIWSIGNEESAVHATPAAARIASTMQTLVHKLDPSRLATYAANEGDDNRGVNSVIDVRGWNYYDGDPMDSYHKKHPTQPNIGTEQASTLCTRGIYTNDKAAGYMSAYDDNAPRWGDTSEHWWNIFAQRPWLSGGFVWTGFDYRGEPTPYEWPCINSHFGIMDTCGFPKDNFYYYQAWWSDQLVLHLFPHWNWPGREGEEVDVRCFSNCEEVELMLNGQSLGRKLMPRNGHLQWRVKYAPGTLRALGYRAGKLIAETKVETTDAPAGVKLAPDRNIINADGEDLSIITVAVADAKGRVVPTAGNLVRFELTGPGKILGVGNGDPSCHEPDFFLETNRTVTSMPFDGWRMLRVSDTRARPETADNFDESGWARARSSGDATQLEPNQSAVFRNRFTATPEQLAATNLMLTFGTIDDDGWLYVNGQAVGESHDWSEPAGFDIRKFLREGENTVAVVVHNTENTGGIGRGVSIAIPDTSGATAVWQRSVFNGLAQIIVQAGRQAGEIRLTARADGLAPATVEIHAEARTPRPAVP